MKNKERAEKLKKKTCDEIERLTKPGMLGEEVAYSGDYVISFSLDNDSILMWSEYSVFMDIAWNLIFEKISSRNSKENEL